MSGNQMKPQIENKLDVWNSFAAHHTTLNCQISESHGFGLVASKDTPAHTLLLQVPEKLAISEDTCIDDAMAQWLLGCLGEGPHLLHRVVVYLALQTTQWTPYFKLLPNPEQLDLPFAWTDQTPLEGTSIGDAASAKKRLVAAFLQNTTLDKLDPNLWVLAYEWIASRSLTHPQTNKSVLVPVLDLANHSSEANARYDFHDGHFVLVATKEIASGSEIFIDYGPRSAGEFLFKYGFVPEEPDSSLTRTYDPLDPEVRKVLDVSRDPDVQDEETRQALEAAYCILVQFVGNSALIVNENKWQDSLVVLVACEDLVELKCVNGEYDLYVGEDPIVPEKIGELLSIPEVGERADALVRDLAQHFIKILPEPTAKTCALIEHERAILEGLLGRKK